MTEGRHVPLRDDHFSFGIWTDALGARGMAYEHLDQLALEHLCGVR
jgi:hypothetical protein